MNTSYTSNVGQYVNVMRKSSALRVNTNPNSEMSMLKQELVGHYKSNPDKAWALINGMESGDMTNISEGQRLHYDAAVIAVRGYTNNTVPSAAMSTFTQPNQQSELDKLKRAGWQPLNKSQLLQE